MPSSTLSLPPNRLLSNRVLAILLGALLAVTAVVVGPASPAAAATTVSGRITAKTTGAGIASVQLNLHTSDFSPQYQVYTDANGFFTFTGVAPETYSLRISYFEDGHYGDYVTEWWSASTTVDWFKEFQASQIVVGSSPIANLNEDLWVGGTLTGVISGADATGSGSVPLSNIRANATGVGVDAFQYAQPNTNASGVYTIYNIPPGNYELAYVPEYGTPNADTYASRTYNAQPYSTSTPNLVTFAEGQDIVINQTLPRFAEVSGTVTGGPDNVPLANVGVQFYTGYDGPGSPASVKVYTNASGQYSVGHIEPGTLNMYIDTSAVTTPGLWAEGGWYPNFTSSQGTAGDVEIGGGVQAGPNVVVPQVSGIQGTITDAMAPTTKLAGINVVAYQHNYVQAGWATTDANGHYVIKGLAPGEYTLQFSGAPWATEWWNDVTQEYLATYFEVEEQQLLTFDESLIGLGTISGTVRGGSESSSEPLGAYVTAYDAAGNWLASASSDPVTGAYVMTGVPEGERYVSFSASSGYYTYEFYDNAPSQATADAVTVERSATTSSIDAILAPYTPAVHGTKPTIIGTAIPGSQLSVALGSWYPQPITYAYQWYADGVAIAGARSATYTPIASQVGKMLTVTVKGSKTDHTSAWQTSWGVTVGQGLTGPAPVLSTTDPQIGVAVTVNVGTWTHPRCLRLPVVRRRRGYRWCAVNHVHPDGGHRRQGT